MFTTAHVTRHHTSSATGITLCNTLMFAAIAERPGVQGVAFKATSSRGTRQLMVNRLYSTCNLTLPYADSQPSSLWVRMSQHHLASLAAAVVP